MTYIIEKITQQEMQKKEVDTFLIKHTREAVKPDGEKVEIIDENRTEQITVAQLEAQKVSYQNAIKDIDEKLAKVALIK